MSRTAKPEAVNTSKAGVNSRGNPYCNLAVDIVISVTPSIASGNLTTIVGLLSICNAFGRVLFGGMYDKLGRRVTMEVVNALFMLTAILMLLALLRHGRAVPGA